MRYCVPLLLCVASIVAASSASRLIGLQFVSGFNRTDSQVWLQEFDMQSGQNRTLNIFKEFDITMSNGAVAIPGTSTVVFFSPLTLSLVTIDIEQPNNPISVVKLPSELMPLSAFSQILLDATKKIVYIVYPQTILSVDFGNYGIQRVVANMSLEGQGTGPDGLTMKAPVLDVAKNRILAFWGPQLNPNTVISIDLASGKFFKLAPLPLPGNFSLVTASWDASNNVIRMIGKGPGFPAPYGTFVWNPDTGAQDAKNLDLNFFLSTISISWAYDNGSNQLWLMVGSRGTILRIDMAQSQVMGSLNIPTVQRWESIVLL